ncbi:hypothetical protein G6O69_00740 [Pseudenhygromyxa sp. WMMC2535]|uniref:hypothetical protein n=1 Tax=Pseudenhygromyxa sp. WMMC2535 TaxID=2712867 RepID=UPI0015516928|nr:hypothetical protein [Pseudenhygromyxa sp. WMMC2535]NVB36336.1 hypothetical protein [Pseudenhygromyxa sp. WMMC2535]
MATINIGGYTATVETTNSGFSGTLELIVHQFSGIDVLRICSSQDEDAGALIQGSYDPLSATIDGKLILLAGLYEKEIYIMASETGFDVPLPSVDVDGAEVGGRVKLDGNEVEVTLDITVDLPLSYKGVSLTPQFTFQEITTIELDTLPALGTSQAFTVSASILGVSVSVGPIPLSVPLNSISSISDKILEVMLDEIEDIIEDYLLGWAQDLGHLATDVANYVADFAGSIVDAVADFFGGGGSDSPPPPYLVNASSSGVAIDTFMFAWGQGASFVDGAQVVGFPTSFGGPCRAALVTTARPNIASSLSVSARAANSFSIDRHNDISYHIPFNWLAFGPAPGASMAESGYVDHGSVRIQWGRGVSTSDDGQSFSLPAKFGSGPVSVVVCADQGGVRPGISLSSVNASVRGRGLEGPQAWSTGR